MAFHQVEVDASFAPILYFYRKRDNGIPLYPEDRQAALDALDQIGGVLNRIQTDIKEAFIVPVGGPALPLVPLPPLPPAGVNPFLPPTNFPPIAQPFFFEVDIRPPFEDPRDVKKTFKAELIPSQPGVWRFQVWGVPAAKEVLRQAALRLVIVRQVFPEYK